MFDDTKASRMLLLNAEENVVEEMKFDHVGRTRSMMDVRLAPIEIHHDSSVLSEIIKKLEVISVLPFVIENREKFKSILGNELLENLERHKIILDAYKDLSCTENKLDEENEIDLDTDDSTVLAFDDNLMNNEFQNDHPKRNQSALSNNSLELVIQKLRFSTKIIFRSFFHNPTVLKTILSDKKSVVSPRVQDFIDKMKNLKTVFAKKAAMSEEEKMNKIKTFNSLLGQRDCNDQQIKKLEGEISLIEIEMQNQLASEDEKAMKLKKRIKNMISEHDESLKSTNLKSKKQEIVCTKNHESKMKKLIQEIEQVKSKFETALNFHFSEESQLRKKKYKVEAEFEDAMQHYDKEMMDRQEKIEEIRSLYTEEKEMLEVTEQKFRLLEMKYERVMEERRMDERKLHLEQLEMQKLVRAVTVIQSMWRSYKVNRSIKVRKKKMAAGHNGRRKSVMKKSKMK